MTTLLAFCLFCVVALFVLLSHRFKEYSVWNLGPLIRYGLDAECTGAFVKANDPGQANPLWLYPTTVILGYDKQNRRSSATASFSLSPLPRNIFGKNVDVNASLMIEAARIHGGLHSHIGPKQKKAVIQINGQSIEEFWLIDHMPNGEDYGYRNVGPIPIACSLLEGPRFDVTLKIEEQMAWDIDRIVLQINKGSYRLTVFGSMIAGALISAAAGILPEVIKNVRTFF